MAYADIWTHANDSAFQGRCWAALWDICNKVSGGEVGYPAAGMAAVDAADDTSYAIKVLRDEARVTARQLAQQILRNPTIATNPSAAADSDLAWQINNAAWAELRGIG